MKIIKLFISKIDSKKRVNTKQLIVDKFGIYEDKFYKKDINRSILLTSINAYNIALKNNIDISYGLLGENILFDFDIHHLKIGTKIALGTTILEITQQCTICNHLNTIHDDLPEILKYDRGIFAKTISKGIINIGDDIKIISQNKSLN
jgi:MOSC domain-containing protein YiiM